MRFLRPALLFLLGIALSLALVGVAAVTGAYYYFKPGLPSAETMRDVQLQTPLRIYSRDGRLLDQIGEKRRTPVEYEEIPEHVIQAFLAAEDDRFFEHPGFDYQGIIRATANLVLTGSRSQGGSTITQQLARVYFLTRERSFIRKAKELILAMQIEREFSKEEILALYLNKIFLGQRAYGVGAAAEVYFGKPLQQLSIAEAATIAGLPKAPSALNPVTDIDRATERRAYVLRRMLELNHISADDYEQALETPMMSRLHGPRVALRARYVAEMVRADIFKRFGDEAYTAGYKVVTTIDGRLQNSATTSLRSALLEYDRRHGYRGPVAQNALAQVDPQLEPEDRERILSRVIAQYPNYRDLHTAVVLSTNPGDNSAEVFIRGRGYAQLAWDVLKWPRYINDNTIGDEPASVDELVKAGDVVQLLYSKDKGWLLGQLPEAQAAFVAIDPHDGAIVALTGGFDFAASKFNRAVQSRRQPGSSFKPFIYSAALAHGFTPSTVVNDAPVVFEDEKLEETWRPENYSRSFNGPTRLREALVRSLNLVSVRILLGTGIAKAADYISGFGLPDSALPRDSSLALGSGGAAPLDVAAGYATFASGGFRTEPYLIERILNGEDEIVFSAAPVVVCEECALEGEDREAALKAVREMNRASDELGQARAQILPNAVPPGPGDEVPDYPDLEAMIRHAESWRPTANDAPRFVRGYVKPAERVVSATNAYLIYDMMRDVIRRGTGRRARDLGRNDIAGKTGTSNDRRDAWFSGFNGDLVATAWVGFDQERSLGAGEEGSRTALPMWKYFMSDALAQAPNASISRPRGIVSVRIDPESGLVAPAGYAGAIFEIFEEGHLPERMTEDSGPLFSGTDSESAEEEFIF